MTRPAKTVRFAGAAVVFVVMLGVLLATRAAAGGNPAGGGWRYEAGRHLALLGEHGVVWQLNFKKEEGKPYLHPVSAPDGVLLTWHRPSDHPWHRALWFSWKLINGLNYWEPDAGTGKLQGLSDVLDVEVPQMDQRGARVVMRLGYHPPNRPTVLEEIRTLTISAPDAQRNYRIDWHQRFTATKKQDVVLDRTPPKEKPWGGYGGLSYRAARSMTDVVLLDSRGRRNGQIHGQSARWVDASGSFGAEKKSDAGVTIFDHPSNPRHPTLWYIALDPKQGHPFVYTNPALLFNEPLTLPAGESLDLDYRVLIHAGRGNPKRLNEEFERFAGTDRLDRSEP